MTKICPVCRGLVGQRDDGTLYPHARYADGGGYAPGQDHSQVPCEGGTPPSRDPAKHDNQKD